MPDGAGAPRPAQARSGLTVRQLMPVIRPFSRGRAPVRSWEPGPSMIRYVGDFSAVCAESLRRKGSSWPAAHADAFVGGFRDQLTRWVAHRSPCPVAWAAHRGPVQPRSGPASGQTVLRPGVAACYGAAITPTAPATRS